MTTTTKRTTARPAPATTGASGTSPLRVAIYCRVSTAEQARPDAVSLEQQEAICREEAERLLKNENRDKPEAAHRTLEVVEVYSDPGVSGTKTALSVRPAGRRLVADAEAGAFEVVIFRALDRFGRNTLKGLTDIERLERPDPETGRPRVRLVFVKENLDTESATGKLFRSMMLAFAEWEAATIEERSLGGMYGRAEKHRWPKNHLPYGLKTEPDADGRKVVVDEVEAERVRRIYRLRAEQGLTYRTIATALNADGIPSPMSTPARPTRWSATSVKGVLHRAEVYTSGEVVSHVRRDRPAYTYPFTPIVSKTLAQEAGAIPVRSVVGETTSKRLPGSPLSRHLYHDHAGMVGIREVVVGQRASKRRAEGDTEAGGKVMLTGRIEAPEGHAGRSVCAMYPELRNGVMTYRCSASKGRPEKAADCPGLALVTDATSHPSLGTAWPATDLEARVLLYTAQLLEDPARLAAWLRQGEGEVLDTLRSGEAPDRERVAALARERRKVAESVEKGWRSPEEGEARMADILAELAEVEARLVRLERDRTDRATVAVSVERLMTMTVADIDPEWRDPNTDERPADSRMVWAEAREAVARLYDPETRRMTADLPGWVRDLLGVAVTALGVRVTVRYNEADPFEPVFEVAFESDRLAGVDGGTDGGSPTTRVSSFMLATGASTQSRPDQIVTRPALTGHLPVDRPAGRRAVPDRPRS